MMKGNLLQLNRDVIRRNANGKTIWQPRILGWYDDRVYRHEEFLGKFRGCNHNDIYEAIGCSDRLYQFGECLKAKIDPSVKPFSRQIDDLTWEYTMETPVGKVSSVVSGNSSNPGTMPKKWWVETENDLKVFAYIEEATTYTFDMDTYHKLFQELSHLGLPTISIQRPNMQRLIVELSGVISTTYLLEDCPDAVEDYFKALSRSQEQMLRVVADSPIEWINYGDNLHCRILPPTLYKKYVLPEYEKRGGILHAAGKFIYSHWDGDVKGFLPYAKASFLDGIEAITPEPQGDVTLEEVKHALGDEVFLIDGIASILFTNTFPVEELMEQTQRVLELFEGQLILGISDELPSNGLLERVEIVNEMVNDFNSKH